VSDAHSKLTLYDVAAEGAIITDILEANEGELTPELEERLERLMQEGPERIEAAAMVVQNLMASALVCEQESMRLKARAVSFENNAKRLKDRMTVALDMAFGGKVKTCRFTVWTQKAADTTAFDLAEEFTLDMLKEDHPELVRVKLELDKTACKQALERGDTLPEAVYVEHNEGKKYTRIK
jgi:hypothetical protein